MTKYLDHSGLSEFWRLVDAKKVNVEEGKGLSTNDFTNDDKTKLDNLSNYDDTTIVNKITTLEQNTIDSLNQKADITNVYTKDEVYTKSEVSTTINQAVAELPEYTITKASMADAGYAGTYQLFKDGVAIGDKINIPQDQVLKSATVEEVTVENDPYNGAKVGDKYIKFVFQNNDAPQYLSVQDLVDVYVAGSYIEISENNVIAVKYNDIYNKIKTDLSSVFEAKGAASGEVGNITLGQDTAVEGKYVSAVSIVDGVMTIERDDLPKLVVDEILSATSVNAVQNKALYAKFGELSSQINTKFKFQIVDSLPTSEISTNTIYLISQGSTNYLEYIYVNGAWKKIGSNDYYTKEEIDVKVEELATAISLKANIEDVYTKADVDALYNSIGSLSDEDIDNAIGNI